MWCVLRSLKLRVEKMNVHERMKYVSHILFHSDSHSFIRHDRLYMYSQPSKGAHPRWPDTFLRLSCVASARRGGGIGEIRGALERKGSAQEGWVGGEVIPLAFPLLAPATQATLRRTWLVGLRL